MKLCIRVNGTSLFFWASLLAFVVIGYTAPQAQSYPFAPEVTRSIAIDHRYDVPIPTSEFAVYVDSLAIHHTRDEQSTVATRDSNGHWHVVSVVEEGSGLVKVEQHLVSNHLRTVPKRSGQKLDDLLKRPGLYQEKSPATKAVGVGAIFHTMEINTPAGHLIIRWTGHLSGIAGSVADVVIGSD